MQLAKERAALFALVLASIASSASASRTDVDGALLRAPRVEIAQLDVPRFALALEQSVVLELPELVAAPLELHPGLAYRDSKPHVRGFNLALETQPQAPQRFSLEIASGAWETGLLYARNRFYDPEIGRFISADPMGYVDGPSMYGFAGNDPVNNSDPLGLCIQFALNLESMKSCLGYSVGLAESAASAVWNMNPITQGVRGFGQGAATVQAIAEGYQSGGIGEALLVAQDLSEQQQKASQEALVNMIPGVNTIRQGSQILSTYENEGSFEGGRQLGRTTFSAGVDVATVYGAARGAQALRTPTGPVRPGQRALYEDLKARKKAFGETEALDMDHQPSLAAQVRAKETALGRPLTKAEIAKLKATTPAVASPRKLHQQTSPTFGARNSPARVAEDAADLKAAAARDKAVFDAAMKKRGSS